MEGTLLLQQAEVEDAGDWVRVEIEVGHILYFIHKYLLHILYILYTYTSYTYTYTILYKLAQRVKWVGGGVVMDDGGGGVFAM